MGKKETQRKIDSVEQQMEYLHNAIKVFNGTPSESLGEQVIMDFQHMLKERKAEMQKLKDQHSRDVQAEIDAACCMDLPLDFCNEYEDDERAAIHVDSIEEGLLACLNNLGGKVDIEYISKITDRDMRDVIRTLKGAIYQNPQKFDGCFYKGFETSDEYLSGNLVKKLRAAREANKTYKGMFTANINALQSVMPEYPDSSDTYVALGSPWVPTKYIDDFICYISGEKPSTYLGDIQRTRHDLTTGLWEIPQKTRFRYTRAAVRDKCTYGTERMGMLYLIEDALNMRTPVITDPVSVKVDPSGYKREINQKETMLAIEKQKLLNDTFIDWVWRDTDRANELRCIYDENYAGIRKRRFNGSYLTFPGMNKDFQLYSYQKDAVARILFTKNCLLAHDMGSGKTAICIAAGMELRRLGKAKKNLYVVPNTLISQWKDAFYYLYPSAKVLVVDPKNFTKDKRDAVIERIATEEFDGIIMAYSCFDMLPLSERYYKNFYKEQSDKLLEARKVFFSSAPVDRKMKSIKNTLQKISEKLKLCSYKYFFDELEIGGLFVDEAHNYKNIPIETKITNVRNLSNTGSEKCRLMLDKVRCVQANGGHVTLATGTPVSNSVAELFTFQLYLQPAELSMLGLQHFDAWIGNFVGKESAWEIDIDTQNYHLVTRFSKFHNLPELTSILASVADFHKVDKENGIPDFNGYTDVELDGSVYFKRYLKTISSRAENVRKHRVKRETDNLLKICTDCRKASLDMRLIDESIPFDPLGKVESCADNVAKIYKETLANHLTQLIFCDTSTPKKGFNIYDELKKILITKGVKASEIAFIHSADTETKRANLFSDVSEGRIRILIGSTFKLGLGVNVQQKLYAIHHLDVPWRPSDQAQREKRVLRQGNTNKEVKIFRYILKQSFDAYSYQLLETKQRFISQLLAGSLAERNGSDVDEVVLDYAEIKALAVGNPQIKKRCEIVNALDHEKMLQKEYVAMRSKLAQERAVIPDRVRYELSYIDTCKKDKTKYFNEQHTYSKEELRILREKIMKTVKTSVGKSSETYIGSYCGFDIYAPAYSTGDDTKIIVGGNGKYYLEIKSEAGITTRLNNFLEGFDERIAESKERISNYRVRAAAIEEELKKDQSHVEAINNLKSQLEVLDKELGLVS